MMRIRHWKQRYSPEAKMVWAREMVFNGETVKQGDVITDEQKAILGKNRLKKWWDSKVIQLLTIDEDAETADDFDPSDLDPEEGQEGAPEGDDAPGGDDTPDDAPEDPEAKGDAPEDEDEPEDEPERETEDEDK